jgi:hypothetical protein
MQTEELPSEYLGIRAVWLRQINRCNEAFSIRAKPDASMEASDQSVGNRTAVYSVDTLYNSLVDFGEALVRTDVEKWYHENYYPKKEEIWNSKGLVHTAWSKNANLSMSLFNYIIKTLNKYGMLFPDQPLGYSNVEMKSI